MTTRNLTDKDKKELVKFKKYLVFKSLQVILQSRSGRKTMAQSKLISSGSDWFNLSVRDDSKVVDEIKKVYSKFGSEGLTPVSNKCLCLEFSIVDLSASSDSKKINNNNNNNNHDNNNDNDNNDNNCPLEIWRISMSNVRDDSVRVMYGVYNRMSTLIKCLFSVSRVLPTYKLCRSLNSLENFTLKYKMYSKKFEEKYESSFLKSFVGSVPTPEGTLIVDVLYRRDVKIISESLMIGKSLTDINEDYYSKEIPKNNSDDCIVDAEIISISEIEGKISSRNSPDDIISVERKDNGDIVIKDVFNKETIHSAYDDDSKNKIDQPEKPQESEVHSSLEKQPKDKTDISLNLSTVKHESTEKSLKLSRADSELGDFFRECTAAPSLNLFVQSPLESKDVFEDLSSKLAEFEASAKQFDAFVNSIHGLTFD